MNSVNARWYLSATALREYLDIGRLPNDDGQGGKVWQQAERELAAHTQAARFARQNGPAEEWRTGKVKVGNLERTVRLEFTVVTDPRPEGPLAQLVRVRCKGK